MKRWIALAITLVVVAGIAFAGWRFWDHFYTRFTPERCTVVNPEGDAVTLTKEQSRMSSIIIAASFERELPERAATIALATAYQESGIRNLDHGDRDSLGLFQQRPDPKYEWGTADQIMDPWYSSQRFYDELVKFPGWESVDINDQAQKVQRSGFPEAYRKHVGNATALAAAGRGSTQQAITCVNNTDPVADASPIEEVLSVVPGVEFTVEGNEVRISADDEQHLWAAAQLAMLNTYTAGVTRVQVGEADWSLGDAAWGTDGEAEPGAAIVTLGR
jgi:hypothetical protein